MSDQDDTTRDGHRIDASEQRAANSEQGGEQMPMPVRFDTHRKGAGRRCCRTHSGVPRNSASLLETLHRKAMEQETEREAPKSVRQHFVLSTRDPLFFLVLLLYSLRRSRSALNAYLSYPTLFDPPRYLIRP